MIPSTLTMTKDQFDTLRIHCNVGGAREGACQILCGESSADVDPWNEGDEHRSEMRLTVQRVVPLPPDRVRASARAVSWDMDCFISLLRLSRDEELHPGICHSHPRSAPAFSHQDDDNESHLRDLLRRRNRGRKQVLVSVLFRGDRWVDARVWNSEGRPQPVPVRILRSLFADASKPEDDFATQVGQGFLHRQALAVGEETVARLRQLRVGVVGCGGTGSAVVELLARAGVGRLLLVDPDTVSESNLNRLYGSTRSDAETRRAKVNVLRDHVDRMGLGTQVATRQSKLADAATAKLLRVCDIIFGCTDDHLGRLIVNRMAYFYLLPVIDMGISVDLPAPDKPARISGRVTVLRPGTACLLCRGVVSPRRAREQGLRHNRPTDYAQQVKEGYITDSDAPTPVVGTFTTETATAAVNELLAGLAGLRGSKGWTSERTIRYDLDRCRHTGCLPRDGCPICSDMDDWGRGDTEPFLDLAGL